MRTILITLALIGFLGSCGQNVVKSNIDCWAETSEDTTVAYTQVCDNGTSFDVKNGTDGNDGANGNNGVDGANGVDGKDGVNGKNAKLTIVNVPNGSCTMVYPGLWVENIHNGEIFDTYQTPTCSDSKGEYCDNTETSYGSSGGLGKGKFGSSKTCVLKTDTFVGTILGARKDDNSINIFLFDYSGVL